MAIPGLPRLLQVCNVGQICGGTAACAWTVTRSLPAFEHVVAFLGPIADETRAAFAPFHVERWPLVTDRRVTNVRPDVVLLHNTSPSRVRRTWPVSTIQYAHSHTSLAAADVTIYCSRWLAQQFGASEESVCWQGVPRTPVSRSLGSDRDTGRDVIVGRLCTPDRRKWPADVVPFYRALTQRCPSVSWEFVGCPRDLRDALKVACCDRAVFWEPGWGRRDCYGTWDVLLYHHPHLTESFGRTVAEAMRAGCIPVVDRRGGFCEQLDQGGGFLCGSIDDFATALEALQTSEQRQRISLRARQIADERWSLSAFAQRLLARFDEARTLASCGAT